MAPTRSNVKPAELGINGYRQYDWRDAGKSRGRKRRVKLTQPVARYEQVARDLRHRILGGEWAPGVTLPGAPAISAEYRVTQSVAQKALETVVAWRLARTGAGRGTVVLQLYRYRVTTRISWLGGSDPARDKAALIAAVEAAVGEDPMTGEPELLGDSGVSVYAVILAPHGGYAADRLMEIVQGAAGKAWGVVRASVTAEYAGERKPMNGG